MPFSPPGRIQISQMLTLLMLLGGMALTAQEPINQDKSGAGATGHQAPLHPDKKKHKAGKKGTSSQVEGAASEVDSGETAPEKPVKIAYDFELPGPEGQRVKLSEFKGKTLLIVNLATKSSYSVQLKELEKLSREYQSKGLLILGIPSNDFGAAEPDADPALQKLYKADDKLTFPVMAKSELTGVHELPFYTWLTTGKGAPAGGPVHWNYTKFLIDPHGKVVARFDQDVAPESPQMLSAIDEVLSGTFKPHSKAEPDAEPGAADDGEEPDN